MNAALQSTQPAVQPGQAAILHHAAGALAASRRLARMGYTVTGVHIDRHGSGCAVSSFGDDQTPQPAPDLRALNDCMSWLLEEGIKIIEAEWREHKTPRVIINSPAGWLQDAAVIASERLLGGRTSMTWCARRFGCEIHWKEIV